VVKVVTPIPVSDASARARFVNWRLMRVQVSITLALADPATKSDRATKRIDFRFMEVSSWKVRIPARRPEAILRPSEEGDVTFSCCFGGRISSGWVMRIAAWLQVLQPASERRGWHRSASDVDTAAARSGFFRLSAPPPAWRRRLFPQELERVEPGPSHPEDQ